MGRGPPGRGPGRGHGQAPPPPRAPPVPVPTEDFNFEEGIQKFNKEVRYSDNMCSASCHPVLVAGRAVASIFGPQISSIRVEVS